MVVESGVGAIYGSGQLLTYPSGALFAAPFDVGRGRLTGGAVPVVERRRDFEQLLRGVFRVGQRRARVCDESVDRRNWCGWRATAGASVWPRRAADTSTSGLSPDGRYLAIAEVEPHSGRSDLRLLDLLRGTNLRLTTSPATDASPVWSPDGTRLVFRSNRERGARPVSAAVQRRP